MRNGYIYLGNTLVGLYQVNLGTGAVASRYKHTDALGSPVATTDAAKAVLSRTSYTPYGVPTLPVDGVGYTGHFIDVNTSLTYMQQRYYDPQVGRFLSVDPMESDPDNGWNFNRYNYAANNAYRFSDPDGRTVTYASDDIREQVAADAANSQIIAAQLKQAESDTKHNMNFTFATADEEADPTFTSQAPVLSAEAGNSHPNADGTPGSGASVIIVLLRRTEYVNISTHANPKGERQPISSGEKTAHEVAHGLEAMAGVLPDNSKQQEVNAMRVETKYRFEQGLQGKRIP